MDPDPDFKNFEYKNIFVPIYWSCNNIFPLSCSIRIYGLICIFDVVFN